MKTLIMSALAVVAVSAFAAEKPRKGFIERAYAKHAGGLIPAPNSLKGTLGVVDRASGIDRECIDRFIKTVSKEMKYNYKVVNAPAKAGLPTKLDVEAAGLDVAVFVVSDDALPPSLVAVEDRWALVNIKKLHEGLKDDELGKRLYAARCRGELMRAFALACGCGSSQYPNNILDATTVKEIDQTDPDGLIFDMVQRCKSHLERIGVTPKKMVAYNVACEQGWAPAPTNDVQKAIWAKVHAIPDKPIKIEFDPKRDAGK